MDDTSAEFAARVCLFSYISGEAWMRAGVTRLEHGLGRHRILNSNFYANNTVIGKNVELEKNIKI